MASHGGMCTGSCAYPALVKNARRLASALGSEWSYCPLIAARSASTITV